MKNRNIFFVVLCIAGLMASCKQKTLFDRIPTEVSGIDFSNRIVEKDSINILEFEYVYNGAGVGIGDFNKDGLQDVFFSGNQVKNKLYLNNGEFKFEDISGSAQIEGKGRWCAGVVTVDINNDGWLDVYVAATVKGIPKERENLLYVNQGLKNNKPWFKEMGAEYGVNDNGHSENAAFFDYDNDGDLDLYVLTNMTSEYPNLYRKKINDGTNPNTDRLYRCEWSSVLNHPVYTNISKEAGIILEGYGLGLNICDINNDGWKDIFVTNDYLSDDLLYINDKHGKFVDQAANYFKHTSNSAMGNDVADVNNDGFLDVFSVDMLAKTNERKKVLTGANNNQSYNLNKEYGYTFQYMRNTLQLNNGLGTYKNQPKFSEISMFSGLESTDWSWTPSLADFDNDGNRDIFITNGFPKDVTDRDFISFRNENERFAEKSYLLEQIPAVKISNYAFRNLGHLQFEDVTEKWGLEIPSFSNGAVYADLDNDGDLDYVVNNINDSAFVYKNNLIELDKDRNSHYLRLKLNGNKENINGIGAVAILNFENGEKIIHENNPFRGYLSSVEPFIHFGLGKKKLKSLEIRWYNGRSQIILDPKVDTVLNIDISNAKNIVNYEITETNPIFNDITDIIKFDYLHKEQDFIDFNYQNLMPFKLSELGPGLSVGDVNGDLLEDVYIGGSKNYAGVFALQQKDGSFIKKPLIAESELKDKNGEDLGSLLFDADGDLDLDLYICRGGNEAVKFDKSYNDVLYLNDGKGEFKENENSIPILNSSNSCVRAADYDNDGDLDLFVAGRNVPSEYPKFTSSYILRNDSKLGKVKFTNLNLPLLKDFGLVCDVLWTDYNNDGWPDILIVGEWASPRVIKNTKGTFSEEKTSGLEDLKGLWSSINGGDFDNDGDIDYVLGNIGLNTLLKGSKEEPIKILAKDFDKNGNYDIVPFAYFIDKDKKRKLVPFNGKDDVNKQLNITRSRFVTYKEFAKADFNNLLTKEERVGAQELNLNYNKSIILINNGNGKFTLKDLPDQVQFSPVNGVVVQDFNQDGIEDLVLSGNNYANEISSGRYDASNGNYLEGLGNGEFKVVRNSGFYVPYDAKSLVSLTNNKGEVLLFAAQNSGPIRVFKTNLSKQKVGIPLRSKYYTYQLNNKKVKREFYFGSSYLGQSERFVVIPKNGINLKIH